MSLFDQTLAVPIAHESQVGEARRVVARMAGELELPEPEAGKAAIVATEAARNLVLHGGGGELLVRALERYGSRGIELVALDRGPGMADPGQCMRDGYSTAGTPGTGLGAMARLSLVFDLWSRQGAGTAVLSQVWSPPARPSDAPWVLVTGAVCRALDGETECGDTWAIDVQAHRAVVLVSDGLGHGPLAAAASREVLRALRASAQRSPKEILEAAHGYLRGTRGAAVAVAELDRQARVIRYAGIGNISGSVDAGSPGGRSMVSLGGTIGHEMRTVHQYEYPWPERARVVLHSDGLSARWQLDAYPGLGARHPALMAGVLYRDHARRRDDATVVVVREE